MRYAVGRDCVAMLTACDSDMAVKANPDTDRPTDAMVDVLIIGAGASGAAVAWSLAETRMKILCLEQGDWIKPTEFPTNGRDWEARRYADFDISPNRRARDTDYPINDDNSLMKIANFNGVGGGTILFTAHYPRLHPSDFRVRTLDGIADDWPIDYWALEPYFAENDRMTGVAGLAGDPAYPPHQPTMPPVPLGKTGTRYARANFRGLPTQRRRQSDPSGTSPTQ
jgi:choline dehydrogenase-like flavoprotein